MVKTDDYYIEKILKDMEFILKHMEKVSLDDFSNDPILQDSMMFRLIQISENAKYISDEYKEYHSKIPWYSIYGLRNRIVHDYGNVDLKIVFDTIKCDIPGLLNMLAE